MTGNAKSEDGDSVRMCAKCSDGYYMLATGYSETKVKLNHLCPSDECVVGITGLWKMHAG